MGVIALVFLLLAIAFIIYTNNKQIKLIHQGQSSSSHNYNEDSKLSLMKDRVEELSENMGLLVSTVVLPRGNTIGEL